MYFFSRLFGLNSFQSSSLMTANAAIITNRREKETALKKAMTTGRQAA